MPDLLIEVGCERSSPPAPVARSWSRRPGCSPRRWPPRACRTAGPRSVSVAPAPVRGPRRRPPGGAGGRDQPHGARPGRRRRVRPRRRPHARPPTASPAGRAIAVADLVVREDGGREFVFAEIHGEGRPMEDLVPDVAAQLIGGLRFSKTMRWGDGHRPALLAPGALDRGQARRRRPSRSSCTACASGDVSQGHRFLGGPATIADGRSGTPRRPPRRRGDREPRRAAGDDPGRPRRGGRGGGRRLERPGGKLEEVLFLMVEWPSVITGRFDERHLRLPARVLVTAMQGHQRYFPLRDPAGELLSPSSRCPTATRRTPRPSPAATRACSTRACRTPSSASTRTSRRASPRSTGASTRSCSTSASAR